MQKISLEMSLKPFCGDRCDAGFCRRAGAISRQWQSLWEHGADVEVHLWTSDGFESQDCNGDLDGNLEYGRYIGSANPSQSWLLETEYFG